MISGPSRRDGPAMAHDIFISYRRRDSAAFAARLRDRVESVFRDQVFLDVSGIDAGDDYVDKLAATVRGARAVVAVIGPNWAHGGSEASKRLGEPGDFVTAELAAAIESGIALLPVLIEGARMPSEDELPDALRALARRNAIVITHAHFDSDAGHLIAALYKPLGIAPPGRIERTLEALGGKVFDQRARGQSAWLALGAGVFAAGLLLAFALTNADIADILTPVGIAVLALTAGLVGRNTLRAPWAAWAGMGLAFLTLVAAVALLASRSDQLLREPWLEAGRAAQVHARAAELPAQALYWSSRVPFVGPPPTVDCPCLAVTDDVQAARPLPASAQLALANRCAGWATVVVTRTTSDRFIGIYPWLPTTGRDFAVVALVSGQTVRVPLAGAHEFSVLPWICQRDGADTKPKPVR